MEPARPETRESLIAAAAKAFVGQCPHLVRLDLEQKFDEREALLARRFNTESGALPAADEQRLQELNALFKPTV